MSPIPLIARAEGFADRTAIIASEGTFTYAQLLADSAAVASCLLDGESDLAEARVAFLTPPGYHYAATQWGVWRAGGVTVPLATSHPKPELAYMIEDSGATIVIAHPMYEATLRELAEERGLRFLLTPDTLATSPTASLPDVDPERRAMIIYTSGTTNRPKGVVSLHTTIQAQMTSLVEAWGWSADDRILHVLPLHHIHGIVNVLGCALWSGAVCEMLPAFDANAVWDRIERGGLSLFMAVPTIYARLVQAWNAAPPERQASMTSACAQLRLMVSGSAALPVQTLEEWEAISGHVLLERYGMTEIGMALSNPLHGERRPGYVGTPLPGVDLRLVDEDNQPVPPGPPARSRCRAPLSSPSTGASRKPPRPSSSTAGSRPATSPCSRTAPTASSAAAASTSSRPAASRSPPLRWRTSSASTRTSTSAPSSPWRTSSGASASAPPSCSPATAH